MSVVATAAPRIAARRRALIWTLAAAIVAGLVYLMATASTGPVDPTEVSQPQSRATIVFNAGMIVFREGLEAVLIFAAVTASFRGANRARRRPVVLGALCAFGAAVATWFVVQAVLDAASGLGPRLEAITGFLAIVVLLLVLNWFVHKVYWSQWIARHHRQRRKLLASRGAAALVGLVALSLRRGSRGHRARRARVHERLPRGLRGRSVPPEPAAPGRLRHGAGGRRDRPAR